MKTFSIWIVIFTVIFLINADLQAVPAKKQPITITQSDGTEITYLLCGDEFLHYKTTVDGYVLIPNGNEILTYGKQDSVGNWCSTQVIAHNVEQRTAEELRIISQLTAFPNLSVLRAVRKMSRVAASTSKAKLQKVYPLSGSPKSLVILVNFSDKSFVTSSPKTAFTNLLNQANYSTNGGTGSARDYFRDNSMGVFDPQFDVVGPFTLPQKIDYYGKNGSTGDDENPQQMVIDACTLANANGLDFSQYDTDKDGVVDNVFIYYAGYNEAEGAPTNTVWPHRWSLNNANTKFDNAIVYYYACTSELRGSTGSNMCGIGTFCHEFGHVLGLPDFYATNSATHMTLSNWDIMDYGPYLNSGRTPPAYSSYERFFLNWLVPEELKSPQAVTLNALTTSNKAYLITQNGNHNLNGSTPSPVEFFMLENRQKKGWDAYLPNSGMLVSHIYYNAGTWSESTVNNDPTAMGVAIVEADGKATETTLPGDPFPGTSAVHKFTPTLRSGTNIGKPLTEIIESNGVISFSFMGGKRSLKSPVANAAIERTTGSFVANWTATPDSAGVIYDKGYYVTAYNISEGTSSLNEDFKNGLTASQGWTISAQTAITTNSMSGKSAPAIQFSSTGEYIQTEKYLLPASSFSFFVKYFTGLNGYVLVEAWNGSTWTTIDTVYLISTLSGTKTYTFNTTSNYTQFRLTYSKGTGYAIIDDLTVNFAQNLEYNAKDKWVASTSDTLTNLIPNRTYFYKVKASDKTLSADSTILFEHITDYSNLIQVQTLEDKIGNVFRVGTKGTINILIPTKDLVVRVFSIIGQQLKVITPKTNIIEINDLPHGRVYILEAGGYRTKVVL